MVRDGNRIDLGLASLWVVYHRVAAGIIFTLFGRRRIPLFSAEVDLAGQLARVVSRVNFRLGSKTFQILTDRFVGIDDDLHLLGRRIEFDQPRVDRIGMRANVQAFVVAFDDREVALAVGRCFLRDDVGGGVNPLRRHGFDGTGVDRHYTDNQKQEQLFAFHV